MRNTKRGKGVVRLKEVRVGVGFVVKERERYFDKQGLRMLLVKRWILTKKIPV